jgi:murein DD-endopeptidase MepM/ murein hydrolase activator NlpD
MFFHLSEVDVATGDKVEKGQTIGKVGDTGRATGPHMHLGLRWLEQRIDPLPLFDNPQELATVTTGGGTENTAGHSEPPEDSNPKN